MSTCSNHHFETSQQGVPLSKNNEFSRYHSETWNIAISSPCRLSGLIAIWRFGEFDLEKCDSSQTTCQVPQLDYHHLKTIIQKQL